MGKVVGPLRLRLESRAQGEKTIRSVFQTTNKRLEIAKRDSKRKKKTPVELLEYVAFANDQMIESRLRDPERYVPRSHNIGKQVRGFIDHLFVKYPVPEFMYRAFCEERSEKIDSLRERHQQWFLDLARGGSFPKLVKGTMTSREAALFLKAPVELKIHQNVWWAKLIAAGVPRAMACTLAQGVLNWKVPGAHEPQDDQMIAFFGRFHAQINEKQFDQLTSFLAWKLRDKDPIHLNGRTPQSVLRLAAEWRRLHNDETYGTFIAWPGLGYSPWRIVNKSTILDIAELRTNRELMEEGRKQRNCVFIYTRDCAKEISAIFSLRAYSGHTARTLDGQQGSVLEKVNELYRITIEVDMIDRTVNQIKARFNTEPTADQRSVIDLWAKQNGLKWSKYCY
jgi:hypothetical protein